MTTISWIVGTSTWETVKETYTTVSSQTNEALQLGSRVGALMHVTTIILVIYLGAAKRTAATQRLDQGTAGTEVLNNTAYVCMKLSGIQITNLTFNPTLKERGGGKM